VSIIPDALERRVIASGLDHVEGVCWDAGRGCLWAGGEAGQVYRIGLDGSTSVEAVIPGGALLGVALGEAGELYVCDPAGHQVWRVREGVVEAYGAAIDYPNYAVVAPDGALYVSDSGSFSEATGRLWRIERDGTTRDVSPRPIRYANGLALDGSTLWIVESSAPGVSAIDLESGEMTFVVAMSRCQPDGLALDAEGGLIISCYQPNQIWRYAEGRLDLLVEDWSGEYILSPTNVAFYGERLDRLALASLCGHDVVSIRPPAPGRPLN
jgi:sugar lactone lactonase YvrE